MSVQYKSEAEIKAVVSGFESCLTAKEEFSHQSHVTVAVWYLHHSTLEQATDSMRAGLFRFLDHHGLGRLKYHETLTVFWVRVIGNEMKGLSPDLSLLQLANTIIEKLSDSRLPFDYYSRELLMSEAARNGWVLPDLKDLV
jgi:hypothetical protein